MDIMDKKQKVLGFIRQKGPSIPSWVYKEIESNILMTSALMSEMVSEGSLIISSVKIGGSPLYYIKGQESALVNYLDKLHEKEKKAVLILKEKLVLRDSILEPMIRIALRQTKDFAKPFTVRINDKKELFWKWFLINDGGLIKKKVYALISSELKKEDKKPLMKEKIKKQEPTKDNQKLKQNKILNQPQVKQIKTENQRKIDGTEKVIVSGNLNEELKKLRIDILTKEVIRKNKEFDMIITLPSTVGRLKYFCKFLDKKKVNDKDLSSAFVKGQMEKLPVLVLITGELNKKAEQMIEDLKGIVVKKIEV